MSYLKSAPLAISLGSGSPSVTSNTGQGLGFFGQIVENQGQTLAL